MFNKKLKEEIKELRNNEFKQEGHIKELENRIHELKAQNEICKKRLQGINPRLEVGKEYILIKKSYGFTETCVVKEMSGNYAILIPSRGSKKPILVDIYGYDSFYNPVVVV